MSNPEVVGTEWCTVHIKRTADGTVRNVVWDEPWHGPAVEFLWVDGNYGCDCNRFLFFERAVGSEPAWDEGECGFGAYSIRVTDSLGHEVYCEDGWNTQASEARGSNKSNGDSNGG